MDMPAEISLPPKENGCLSSQRQTKSSNTDYSHPVYKKLSHLNGDVNKLSISELQTKLNKLRLNSSGSKNVLKKRLKTFYKNSQLVRNKLGGDEQQLYRHILVIDFEATCDDTNPDHFNHEIIEFPVIVVNCESRSVVDTFHRYVRPIHNPQLTNFCTELTGITQDIVNKAETFPHVLEEMWSWLRENGYSSKMAVLTDGPWDMSRFMFLQCQNSGIPFPRWAKRWINIRKTFSNFYGCKRMSLRAMLELAGFEFEGQPHSGIDDSRNIARLAIRLMEDRCELIVNERLFHGKAALAKTFGASNPTVKAVSKQAAADLDSSSDESECKDEASLCS